MPAWAIDLIIAALPTILAAMNAIIQAASGKVLTPAQAAQIEHLQKAHEHIIAAATQPE